MTDKYAGPELYSRFEDIRKPLPWNTLYNLYGITNYATESNDSRPFYDLSSEHWLERVPSENFGDTLYDNTNDKYFVKGYLNSSSELNLSSWFTINQLALSLYKPNPRPRFPHIKCDGVSPTNKLSERQIYRIYDNMPVTAIQYNWAQQSILYYYIHPNYISQENLGWHTESELLQLGYSFTQSGFNFIYNIGSTATSHTSLGVVQYS